MPARGESGFSAAERQRFRKQSVADLASSQFGVVARFQLAAIGIDPSQTRRWIDGAYLHRLLPGVYAVGHIEPTVESELAGAALYAGPGAMLDDHTAGRWLGLVRSWPAEWHVSTPREPASRAGIRVRPRCPLMRWWHNGLPVAPVPYVLLHLAATPTIGDDDLTGAIAEAEYGGWLDAELLEPLANSGRRGAPRLREALRDYHPQEALLRSAFERAMLKICRRYAIGVPRFNARIEDMTVDALWPEEKLVVELDGRGGHQSWARIQRDRRRDLRLRALGHTVLRYVWAQLDRERAAVAQDVIAARARP